MLKDPPKIKQQSKAKDKGKQRVSDIEYTIEAEDKDKAKQVSRAISSQPNDVWTWERLIEEVMKVFAIKLTIPQSELKRYLEKEEILSIFETSGLISPDPGIAADIKLKRPVSELGIKPIVVGVGNIEGSLYANTINVGNTYTQFKINIPKEALAAKTTLPPEKQIQAVAEALQWHYQCHFASITGLLTQGPQSIEQCYVHLATVEKLSDKEKKQKLDNPADKTISPRDDTSTILGNKRTRNHEAWYQPMRTIELKELFAAKESDDESKPTKPAKRQLIVGRAGTGKTTLCQKMVYQWAKNDLWPGQFRCVYWIRLRDWNQKYYRDNAFTLAQAIHKLWQNAHKEAPVPNEEFIQASLDDDGTLLILDGFDEVAHLQGVRDGIGGLIDAVLRYPRIIITARPHGAPQHQRFNRSLEILGFTNQQIKTYVTSMAKHYYGYPQYLLGSIDDFAHDNFVRRGIYLYRKHGHVFAHITHDRDRNELQNITRLCEGEKTNYLDALIWPESEMSQITLNPALVKLIESNAKAEYRNSFKQATQKAEQLYIYLVSHPNLWGIAHIPLNANLLCQLVFEPESSFTLTEHLTLTQIYQAIETLLLQRYLKEKRFKNDPEKQKLVTSYSPGELTELCQRELMYLERLAFKGLQTGNVLIENTLIDATTKEVRQLCREENIDLESGVSLLKLALETDFLENIGNIDSPKALYYFIHPTFQDYLAARYLVRGLLAKETNAKFFQKVFDFIKKTKYQLDWRMVFSFVAGFLSQQSLTTKFTNLAEKDETSALYHFWLAIQSEPTDLIGREKLDLWLNCLSETVEVKSTASYTYNMITAKGRPKFCPKGRYRKRGVYIYRDGNPEQIFALIVHSKIYHEFLNLSNIIENKPHVLTTLKWPKKRKTLACKYPEINEELKEIIMSESKYIQSAMVDDRIPSIVEMFTELRAWVEDWSSSCHIDCRLKDEELSMRAAFSVSLRQHPALWLLLGVENKIINLINEAIDDDESFLVAEQAFTMLAILFNGVPHAVLSNVDIMNALYKALANKNSNIAIHEHAQRIVFLICQLTPQTILSEPRLMAGFKAGLQNQRADKEASSALAILYEYAPNEVSVDPILKASLNVKKFPDLPSEKIADFASHKFNFFSVQDDIDNLLADPKKFKSLKKQLDKDELWDVSCRAGDVEGLHNCCLNEIRAFYDLCLYKPELVVADPILRKVFTCGLKKYSASAFYALKILTEVAPENILANPELLIGLSMIFKHKKIYAYGDLNIRDFDTTSRSVIKSVIDDYERLVFTHAQDIMIRLCKAAPEKMLDKYKLLLIESFTSVFCKDEDIDSMSLYLAYDTLIALSKQVPDKITNEPQLMQFLLDDEYVNIEERTRQVMEYLVPTLTAKHLIECDSSRRKKFIKIFFESRHNVCLTITDKRVYLQVNYLLTAYPPEPEKESEEEKVTKKMQKIFNELQELCHQEAQAKHLPLLHDRTHHSMDYRLFKSLFSGQDNSRVDTKEGKKSHHICLVT